MEKAAVNKLLVDAQKHDGMFQRHECEGYLLFHLHQHNAIVLTGEGTFSNANYVAVLQCLKTLLGPERFEMALATMEAGDYISIKAEGIMGVEA